jgi:hypothetical protein
LPSYHESALEYLSVLWRAGYRTTADDESVNRKTQKVSLARLIFFFFESPDWGPTGTWFNTSTAWLAVVATTSLAKYEPPAEVSRNHP